jgi:hypothetical protein
VTPHLEHNPFIFFEPKPNENPADDGTLEGCLRHAVKVEHLSDKQNLYQCEQCTEEKYGKSNVILINYFFFRIQEEALDSSFEALSDGRPTIEFNN